MSVWYELRVFVEADDDQDAIAAGLAVENMLNERWLTASLFVGRAETRP